MGGALSRSVLSAESPSSPSSQAAGESGQTDSNNPSSPQPRVKITRRILDAVTHRRLHIPDKAKTQRDVVQTSSLDNPKADAVAEDVIEEIVGGTQQSPIDIREHDREIVLTESNPNAVAISMGEGAAELVHNGQGFLVQWTRPSKNTIIINGKTFHAAQFHFHTPSEHTMDGVHQELELHLVHQATDGTLAVIGIFFREGKTNPFLSQFWDKLRDVHLGETATLPLSAINPQVLGVLSRTYFRYRGSLTTPPYTEGVEWVVIHDVMEASREQLDVYHSALPGTNARELQPLNHRQVWFAC